MSWAGEIAQSLKAPSEDLGYIPSTHIVAHNRLSGTPSLGVHGHRTDLYADGNILACQEKTLKIFIKKINVISKLSASAKSVLLNHHTNK